MAARYAALEGGLSAGAYSAAIIATLGSLGAAGVATLPAAAVTVLVDVAFVSQLQLRLVYDVGVLYRVKLDLDDPEDLWKLIRVAFTIKGGEFAREGVVKVVPSAMRWVLKRFYSGPVLAAARGLPFVGKFLLQRNIIKIGIPVIGVPVAVGLNFWTTTLAGRHARAVFRNEARVIELATGMSQRSKHPKPMLWIAWLVIMADRKISDDEALPMRHLVRSVNEYHEVVDDELARLVDIDPAQVWQMLEEETGDLSELSDVADRVASVDGPVNALEKATLGDIREKTTRA